MKSLAHEIKRLFSNRYILMVFVYSLLASSSKMRRRTEPKTVFRFNEGMRRDTPHMTWQPLDWCFRVWTVEKMFLEMVGGRQRTLRITISTVTTMKSHLGSPFTSSVDSSLCTISTNYVNSTCRNSAFPNFIPSTHPNWVSSWTTEPLRNNLQSTLEQMPNVTELWKIWKRSRNPFWKEVSMPRGNEMNLRRGVWILLSIQDDITYCNVHSLFISFDMNHWPLFLI